MTNFLFISGGELLIVGLVVLLLFGAKSIPDVARMLGKGMNEFRRASDEIKRELRHHTSDIRDDFNKARTYVNDEVSDIKKAADTDLNMENTPPEEDNDNTPMHEQPETSNTKKRDTSPSPDPEQKTGEEGPVSRQSNIEN